MTNYKERLDEILNTLGERHIMVEHRLIHLGMPEQNGKNIETRKAKQALASLTKELVAEAKPTNSETQRGGVVVYGDLSERDLNIINQFEQNMLKALEAV